jgi:hypothetical protein
MIEGPYDGWLFKKLSAEEEKRFRQHARRFGVPPEAENWDLFHPVCREEWEKMGLKPGIASADSSADGVQKKKLTV